MFVTMEQMRRAAAVVVVFLDDSDVDNLTAAAKKGPMPPDLLIVRAIRNAISPDAPDYGVGAAGRCAMVPVLAGHDPAKVAIRRPVEAPQSALFDHAPPAPGVFFGRNRYGQPKVEKAAVPNDGERCYTVAEAAAACGLGESTIGREIGDGNLPVYRPTPRRILIPAHSLEQFRRDVLPKIQPRPERQRPAQARQG